MVPQPLEERAGLKEDPGNGKPPTSASTPSELPSFVFLGAGPAGSSARKKPRRGAESESGYIPPPSLELVPLGWVRGSCWIGAPWKFLEGSMSN